MHYIPILSTIITFYFAAAVFTRYLSRKGTHLLMWSIGLLFFGMGTLAEMLLAFTFNEWFLKLWYVCGAMLTAAWLGQGTVWLLVRKPGVARMLTLILTALSLLSVGLVFSTALNPSAGGYDLLRPVSEQYRDILTRSDSIIALTIFLNIYGTITLVGGALYSAYLFWRKRVLLDRMIGNILIATGAMFPAIAGALRGSGVVDLLYISELIGVILMYVGFVKATAYRPVKNKALAASAANQS